MSERNAVYSEDQTKYMNVLRRQIVELFSARAGVVPFF
jgi:hypothetical protein